MYQYRSPLLAPQVRLELTTLRLTAECSAIELLRIILPFLWFGFLCLYLVVSACLWLSLLVSGFLRLCLGAGKTSVSPAPPGSRQLPTLPSRSQLSTISVWRLNFCVRYGYRWCPPAIVTGNFPFGALSIASCPLRFALRFRFAHSPLLSLPSPRTFKTAQVRVDPQTFTHLCLPARPSRSPLPPLSRPPLPSLLKLASSDQALDRLVSTSSTPHSASTADLSTSSSLRGLTCFKQWQSSSSGGLHA